MPTLHRYSVHPALPDRLACLTDLALNLRWTWDHDTVSLFRRLDAEQWESVGHSPTLLLRRVSQHRLNEAAEDEAFVAHLDRVCAAYRDYLQQKGWFRRQFPDQGDLTIAYFCMEFGMTESLPIYSGGLGVLAGDHLKTASDLDLPLVAVGLLYQKGYFTQYLNADGWQLERYDYNDFSALPIKPAQDSDGRQVSVSLDLAGRQVAVRVWQAQVGRIPLYLLDTRVASNDPRDQEITAELYGGGPEERLRQEFVLGIGGIRALSAMGLRPQLCHMNEGHSAFL
jgi:starch phosphorylase